MNTTSWRRNYNKPMPGLTASGATAPRCRATDSRGFTHCHGPIAVPGPIDLTETRATTTPSWDIASRLSEAGRFNARCSHRCPHPDGGKRDRRMDWGPH
jgi:hypothetical protein